MPVNPPIEQDLSGQCLWLAKNVMRLHEISCDIGFTYSLGEHASKPQQRAAQTIIEVADRIIQALTHQKKEPADVDRQRQDPDRAVQGPMEVIRAKYRRGKPASG